jgi:hypothetical protein
MADITSTQEQFLLSLYRSFDPFTSLCASPNQAQEIFHYIVQVLSNVVRLLSKTFPVSLICDTTPPP